MTENHTGQSMEEPVQEAPATQPGGKWAERASGIKADPKRVRKYDLYLWSDWGSDVAALVMGAGLGVLAGWLFGLEGWWWTVPGVVVSAAALLGLFVGVAELWQLFGGERYRMYGKSLLVGAVVVNENPLTVVALTNVGAPGRRFVRFFDGDNQISRKEYEEVMALAEQKWTQTWEQKYMMAWQMYLTGEAEKIWRGFWGNVHGRFRRVEGKWACMLYTVGSGDWSYKRGDRIPCASAYDELDEKRLMWREVKLLPLVWGTNDGAELERCVDAVPQFEWDLLREVAPLMEEREMGKLYLLHWMPEDAQDKYGFEPAGTVK